MAEHRNSSNSGHLPFRRYVPPTDKLTNHFKGGGNNGQVMPFPQASTPPNKTSAPPTHEISNQRARADRSRWRRWINVGAAPKAPSPEASRHDLKSHPQSPSQRLQVPSQPPAQKPGSPSAAALPEMIRQPFSPQRSSQRGYQVSQIVANSSAHRNPPQGRPTQQHSFQTVNSVSPPPGPIDPRLKSSTFSPRTPVANKVTPLRRKPVWSTPVETTSPTEPLQRERRATRSRGRKAPRPILLGIRLLILGTGLAAIAGTILSTANSGPEASVNNSTLDNASKNESLLGRRNQAASVLSKPLPLAEELAHLETDLVELGALTPGLVQSIFLYDLDTGNYVDLDGAKVISSASTIKMPILIAFLEAVDAGTLRLDQAVMLREELVGGGSGDMQTHEPGSRYTALNVATEMIVNSDNTATNMMIDLLGGRELLNQRFRAWGLENTVLRNSLPDLEGTNKTSPADLVRLMALVERGELLEVRSRDRLLGIMQRTYNRALIPDGLGDGSAIVFNKTGDIGTSLGDIALVDAPSGKRYILSVIVERPHNDGRAGELIRRVAGRVHEEMNQPMTPVGGTTPATTPSDISQPEEALPGNSGLAPTYPSGIDTYENPN